VERLRAEAGFDSALALAQAVAKKLSAESQNERSALYDVIAGKIEWL
jgi:hypothetical protein